MGNVTEKNQAVLEAFKEPVTMGSETAELKLFEDPDGQKMPLVVINGNIIPPLPGILQNIFRLREFQFRDNEIILTTFPRAGTHFTWEIIHMLLQGSPEYIAGEKEAEFLEMFFMNDMDKKQNRVLNTHLPPELLPPDYRNRKCKFIHVYRNPKDVLVSLYNHWMMAKDFSGYSGSFSGFFELAMKGQVESGYWFDYELKFQRFFQENPDIPSLTLSFEDLKEDPVAAITKISDFLERPRDDDLIAKIADAVSFKKMKAGKFELKTEMMKSFASNEDANRMYRKGEAGDWKNWFTVAQNERFDAEFQRRMKETPLNLEIKWQV